MRTNYHFGRSWEGHPVEDHCPCPQEECGLINTDKVLEYCPQHHWSAGKTIRQGHPAEECPGYPATYMSVWLPKKIQEDWKGEVANAWKEGVEAAMSLVRYEVEDILETSWIIDEGDRLDILARNLHIT